jgi:thymidylate kinase
MTNPSASDPGGPHEPGANGNIQGGRYYGRGIPYLPVEGFPGKLIAIEGTDGVGRSTQIQLLREWLEIKGYGVVETGWTRSPLMQPTIELAKSSNTLNKLTFVLLYATDFADRLEKEIIPALKAGFVVLSDRYIFTALARAGVRGVDRQWLRNLYGFAIAPHLVCQVADRSRPGVARHGLLGIGDGFEKRRRHLRQLQDLPESPVEGVRVDGRRVPLPRRRRTPIGRSHSG